MWPWCLVPHSKGFQAVVRSISLAAPSGTLLLVQPSSDRARMRIVHIWEQSVFRTNILYCLMTFAYLCFSKHAILTSE